MTMKPPKDKDDEGEDGGGSDEDDSGMVGLGFSLTKDYFENNDNNFAPYAYNACLVSDVLGQHTITHETGHNMGAGHSDVQKSSPGPQLYDYSSGYYFAASGIFGSSARFCTIMAYEQEDPEGGAAVGHRLQRVGEERRAGARERGDGVEVRLRQRNRLAEG